MGHVRALDLSQFGLLPQVVRETFQFQYLIKPSGSGTQTKHAVRVRWSREVSEGNIMQGSVLSRLACSMSS